MERGTARHDAAALEHSLLNSMWISRSRFVH